jgi:hypothetical protein
MNTGQMLLAGLATVLLGATILSLNRSSTQHGTILQQTEIGVYGVSIATSVVEEAQGMAFDEKTTEDAVTNVNGLTSTLGPESGETTSPASSANFDDFDDFNGLNQVMAVNGVDQFRVRARVFYVTPTSPNTASSSRTWYKRLDVEVSAASSLDTVRTSFIFSYFNFR